jgi:protein-tyrosine phosphatase
MFLILSLLHFLQYDSFFINNTAFIQDKNIYGIVNCIKDLSFLKKNNEYNEYIQENIKKYEIIRFSDYLYDITEFIYNRIKKGESIIIICKDGLEHSPYIILAYIIRYGLVNLEIGIKMIRTKILESFKDGFKYSDVFNRFQKKISL